jgi:hypothetical protein
LVDIGESELVFIKGCLGDLLLCGVGKLHLKVVEEVKIGILNVIFNWIELLKALKHCFHPSIDS